MIQGVPGNLAAGGPDWEDLAAVRRETGQTVVLRLENKVAETVGALAMVLAVDPGTVGAYGAADKVVLPGHEEQKKVEGGVALDKASGQVVLAEAGNKGFAAGLGEEPGQAGCNMVPDPESHSLLVPVVHKIPSKQSTQTHKTSNTTEEITNTDTKMKLRHRGV